MFRIKLTHNDIKLCVALVIATLVTYVAILKIEVRFEALTTTSDLALKFIYNVQLLILN